MPSVEDFIYTQQGAQQQVLWYLHELLTDLGLTPRIRYKIPFYDGKSWICYLNPTKAGGIELAFTRGNELSNAQGLLQAKGRKQVCGVVFHKVQDIPADNLLELLQEAILLDELKPYAGPERAKPHKNKD